MNYSRKTLRNADSAARELSDFYGVECLLVDSIDGLVVDRVKQTTPGEIIGMYRNGLCIRKAW